MKKPIIAINNSFYTHNLFPLYNHFFKGIGCEVLIPQRPNSEGLNYEQSQFCYPMQLSLMLFYDIIGKADFYFLPSIFETDAEKPTEIQRLDFNCACAFITGEPFILKQAFKDFDIGDKIISPSLNFNNGYIKELPNFIKIANRIGISDNNLIKQSYQNAITKQQQFQNELYEIGNKILVDLEKKTDEYAIVLLGRSYNSTSELSNKSIPRKFASRNITILPLDMIDVRSANKVERMY